MPKGKRIARLRANSATYQADVINDCEKDHVSFAIAAKKDRAVKATIAAVLHREEPKWFYHAVVTNKVDPAADVMDCYRMRGENRIKELKFGFGMERVPCDQFAANAVFFRIGM